MKPQSRNLLLLLLPVLSLNCFAQKSELSPPPPLSPAEGEKQARALLSSLLSQKPDQKSTNAGLLKIRDAEGRQREVPIRFEIVLTPTNWLSSYAAAPSGIAPGEKFTVLHAEGQPDQYWWRALTASGGGASPKRLTGNELMVPFAGSDFWLADLALEFLRWPEQRVLKKQMRQNLFCDVLQSVNPRRAPGAYSRVVSWIAVNRPEEIVVVHADAYDADDKLLKVFEPKKVQKVNGVWQLEEVELRNRQTGSRTRIEFNLE